jgi:hypothetical protein
MKAVGVLDELVITVHVGVEGHGIFDYQCYSALALEVVLQF